MCKMFASEMCGRVADRAVQMLGGRGYLAGNAVERFYRDVRAFRIYEGTTQIHQLNIAKITLRRAAQKNAAQHEDGVATTAACAA
jgi:acyl-CoA dehydrogenase